MAASPPPRAEVGEADAWAQSGLGGKVVTGKLEAGAAEGMDIVFLGTPPTLVASILSGTPGPPTHRPEGGVVRRLS